MFQFLNCVMVRRLTVPVLALVVLALAAPVSSAAIMTFEDPPVPVGTTYGNRDLGNLGLVVLTQDEIDLAMHLFLLPEGAFFNVATVAGPLQDYFPSAHLDLNNISANFDLTRIPFDVKQVTIEYQEFGGKSNLSVNSGGLHIIETSFADDLPAVVAPGIGALVTEPVQNPDQSWTPGLITLIASGDLTIDNVNIGGQELGIDNITVTPEPATLALLGLGAAAVLRRRRVKA